MFVLEYKTSMYVCTHFRQLGATKLYVSGLFYDYIDEPVLDVGDG